MATPSTPIPASKGPQYNIPTPSSTARAPQVTTQQAQSQAAYLAGEQVTQRAQAIKQAEISRLEAERIAERKAKEEEARPPAPVSQPKPTMPAPSAPTMPLPSRAEEIQRQDELARAQRQETSKGLQLFGFGLSTGATRKGLYVETPFGQITVRKEPEIKASFAPVPKEEYERAVFLRQAGSAALDVGVTAGAFTLAAPRLVTLGATVSKVPVVGKAAVQTASAVGKGAIVAGIGYTGFSTARAYDLTKQKVETRETDMAELGRRVGEIGAVATLGFASSIKHPVLETKTVNFAERPLATKAKLTEMATGDEGTLIGGTRVETRVLRTYSPTESAKAFSRDIGVPQLTPYSIRRETVSVPFMARRTEQLSAQSLRDIQNLKKTPGEIYSLKGGFYTSEGKPMTLRGETVSTGKATSVTFAETAPAKIVGPGRLFDTSALESSRTVTISGKSVSMFPEGELAGFKVREVGAIKSLTSSREGQFPGKTAYRFLERTATKPAGQSAQSSASREISLTGPSGGTATAQETVQSMAQSVAKGIGGAVSQASATQGSVSFQQVRAVQRTVSFAIPQTQTAQKETARTASVQAQTLKQIRVELKDIEHQTRLVSPKISPVPTETIVTPVESIRIATPTIQTPTFATTPATQQTAPISFAPYVPDETVALRPPTQVVPPVVPFTGFELREYGRTRRSQTSRPVKTEYAPTLTGIAIAPRLKKAPKNAFTGAEIRAPIENTKKKTGFFKLKL